MGATGVTDEDAHGDGSRDEFADRGGHVHESGNGDFDARPDGHGDVHTGRDCDGHARADLHTEPDADARRQRDNDPGHGRTLSHTDRRGPDRGRWCPATLGV